MAKALKTGWIFRTATVWPAATIGHCAWRPVDDWFGRRAAFAHGQFGPQQPQCDAEHSGLAAHRPEVQARQGIPPANMPITRTAEISVRRINISAGTLRSNWRAVNKITALSWRRAGRSHVDSGLGSVRRFRGFDLPSPPPWSQARSPLHAESVISAKAPTPPRK
jgi:hypothetical protein